MLAAFLVTFVLTRLITRLIRAGRGPFRNAEIGDVHIHHDVYGIFLMMGAGAAEFVYRPPSPWVQVLAVAFGCGAALTLDELALWLYLKDVYWAQEGRTSVDAVLVASCVGGLLLIGANPLSDDAETGSGVWAATSTIVINLAFACVAIMKGKISTGLIGIVVPLVALVGAVRVAKPRSPWACKWYHPGSRRLAASQMRFPVDRRTWWETVKDKIGGTTQS
ncbi:MAG: hypothetical protein ACRDP8_20675 [Actinopolymorphaceae bacterium]